MKIYKNWEDTLAKFFWIEQKFNYSSYNEMLYIATLKTMKYISRYIHVLQNKEGLKNDLKEVRKFYLKMKIN